MRRLPLHRICHADKLCRRAYCHLGSAQMMRSCISHNGDAKRNDTLIKILGMRQVIGADRPVQWAVRRAGEESANDPEGCRLARPAAVN